MLPKAQPAFIIKVAASVASGRALVCCDMIVVMAVTPFSIPG